MHKVGVEIEIWLNFVVIPALMLCCHFAFDIWQQLFFVTLKFSANIMYKVGVEIEI